MRFLTDFLNEDWSDRPSGPRVYLAAFGKHPGWNDHFDLGIETESLVATKRLIYDQGIRAEIEAQTWDNLAEADRLADFDHWFLWKRPRECVFGCFWSSKDGKGRSLYPMVVCLHLVNLPMSWIIEHAAPQLRYCADSFRAATTAGRVQSTLTEVLESLRGILPAQNAIEAAGYVGTHGIQNLSATIRKDPLIMYPIYTDIMDRLASYAPGSFNLKTNQIPRSQAIRLPSIENDALQTLNAWTGYLMSDLDPAAPLLGIMPAGQDWADFILGQPVQGDLFRIRATPRHIPILTGQQGKPTPRLEPVVARRLGELEAADLPMTSLFNGQRALFNLTDAASRLDGVRSSGRGLFWKLLGKSPAPAFKVYCAD